MFSVKSDRNVLVAEKNQTNYNTLSRRLSEVQLCGLIKQDKSSEVDQQQKLSTFFGVIVPCCLSMLSVIPFLRMGFIVGQAGLLESLLMVLLAYVIISLTVLSICAISTNGAIEGGGAYFMISRALGPEFGGAIGLMFFLANAASTALFVFGIVEGLVSFFGEHGQLVEGVFPTSQWWNYLYGTVILSLCFVICVIGADIYAKTTFIIFLVLLVSLASIVVSFFAKPAFTLRNGTLPSSCNISEIEYTGLNATIMHENVFPQFTVDYTTGVTQNFVLVFAVLFNGCTGIMAGPNMSGDLKNPSRSIPVGTISATGITFFTYQLLVILISGSTPRYLLQCDFSFLLRLNLWPPFVATGVFASSLSAALSCLIGASRILFALARDEIFGVVLRPVMKTTRKGNPIVAVLATWLLVQLTLFFGQINKIAPIVTIFFLFSYAGTNLACLALEWASAPNFRPTFKLFTWYTCLLGFLGSVIMMFLVSPVYAFVSIAVLVILLIIMHFRAPTSSWGYVTQALIFHQVRKYLLLLDIRKEHVKFWRPQILLMVKNPRTSSQLINFMNSIKKSGLLVLGHVNIGRLADTATDVLSVDYQHWLNLVDYLGVKAFVELTLSPSVRIGAEQLLRISGLGGMKPNTIVLGFHDDCPQRDTFRDLASSRDRTQSAGSKIKTALTEAFSAPSVELSNNLDAFFSLPNAEDVSCQEHSLTEEEYVSIILDALKLKKNVCLARYFDELDKVTTSSDKGTVFYIDVWPVNFLSPFLETKEKEQPSSPPSCLNSLNESSSHFDKTCIFLMQMACILNMAPPWKKRKLRIFLCKESGNNNSVTLGQQELEEFLTTIRINAEIQEVDCNNSLGSESSSVSKSCIGKLSEQEAVDIDEGDSLHASQSQLAASMQDKSVHLKKINSIIRSQQFSTAVTFLYLPAPSDGDRSSEYVDMLTKLSDNLGPTLFMHGLSHVISTAL